MQLMFVAVAAFLAGCAFGAICYGVLSADVSDAEWRAIAERAIRARKEIDGQIYQEGS